MRERVEEQKRWIDRCGGNLNGYIEHYGDPGVPPLENGKPKVITIPVESHSLCSDLVRVPDTVDKFYAPHYGEGGTKIYEADFNRLKIWQRELSELEITCPSAKLKANSLNKA